MKLTKEEKAWVKRVQKALDSCPSKRLGYATTGDCYLSIFDVTRYDDICRLMERGHGDFVPAAQKLGCVSEETICFPNNVESTAG